MIAIPQKPKRKFTAKHRQDFAERMFPVIVRVARQAFRDRDPEAKEEAVAEVVAAAFIMFVALVRDGRESLAYATVLGKYGVRRVRIGRPAATPQNVRDVSSLFCQLRKGIKVERLDGYDRQEGEWMEILVEDKTATPADVAAVRIDVADWFRALPSRDQQIANQLALGCRTGEVAQQFGLSAGRISQKRSEYCESWGAFQGDGERQDAVPATTPA
jgi:hypothetical protein